MTARMGVRRIKRKRETSRYNRKTRVIPNVGRCSNLRSCPPTIRNTLGALFHDLPKVLGLNDRGMHSVVRRKTGTTMLNKPSSQGWEQSHRALPMVYVIAITTSEYDSFAPDRYLTQEAEQNCQVKPKMASHSNQAVLPRKEPYKGTRKAAEYGRTTYDPWIPVPCRSYRCISHGSHSQQMISCCPLIWYLDGSGPSQEDIAASRAVMCLSFAPEVRSFGSIP